MKARRKSRLEVLRVEGPVGENRCVEGRVGTVRVVRGVEDEQRLRAEEPSLGLPIEAGERQFAATLERVVEHEQVEQQDRKRVEVGRGRRLRLASDHLRCHEARRSQDACGLVAVDADVVVVADQRVSRPRVEEDISQADVPVAQPLGVQFEERVGEPHAQLGHGGERGVDPACQQVCDREVGRGAQRHHVAEASIRTVQHLDRPQEAVRGGRQVSQPRERGTLVRVGGLRAVPLQGERRLTFQRVELVDRPLAAFAQEQAHLPQSALVRQSQSGSGRKHLGRPLSCVDSAPSSMTRSLCTETRSRP